MTYKLKLIDLLLPFVWYHDPNGKMFIRDNCLYLLFKGREVKILDKTESGNLRLAQERLKEFT